MGRVEICEHQVVVIALLVVNIIRISPALGLVAQDLVDSGVFVVGIVIGARDVIPLIFLSRVRIAASGKIEADTGVDFVGVRDGSVAVLRVDFLRRTLFLVISRRLVV
jgi:hypothetical protein